MSGRSFRFSLSPVLQLRDRAVESAQTALGAAQADRRGAEAVLAQAETAERPAPTGGQTAHTLRAAAAHRERLDRARTDAERALDRVRETERQVRRTLAVAVRDREALAALRDEAADAHRADALRADVLRLDDVALAGSRARTAARS